MTLPTGATARPVRFAQAAFLVLLALKIYFEFAAAPIGDEAYYWMWGQKLALSYFDHPPFHAWMLRLMNLVFGWNLFAIRALTWLTFGGTLWIFWDWAKRLSPEDPQSWFWPSAAIYLAAPMFFMMSSIVFHDHLLIFLCIATAHLFLVFAEKYEATGKGTVWLYAGGAALGLAALTKYNGALFGIGVALFFIVNKSLRPLWRSPHLYLAALLAVAIQTPVFWWNITEGFASYKFHLSERWGGNLFQFHPLNILEFIALAAIFVSPFLVPAIIGMIRRPLGSPFADRARSLAICVFVASSLVMLFLSMFIEIYFYWNIVADVLLMPLVIGWMRRRWVFWLHMVYGLIFACLLSFNNSIIPFGNLNGGLDWTASSTYNWPETAAHVEALRKQHAVGFVAATRYTTAAQLGFAMHDADVTALSARHDQYDFWFDPVAHKGEDALIVTDPQLGTRDIDGQFDELIELEQVPYFRFGILVYRPIIYLGRNFHGQVGY